MVDELIVHNDDGTSREQRSRPWEHFPHFDGPELGLLGAPLSA
jgi:hypothetical protein